MKILPHQKIRITRHTLKKLGACNGGINEVKHMLPLVVSTNPEHNIAIAKKAVQTGVANKVFWPWWRGARYETNRVGEMERLTYGEWHRSNVDMDVLPQTLAAMADDLLTCRAVKQYRGRAGK